MSKISHKMMIMDFSGIYRQEQFYEGVDGVWLDVQNLPGTNCYCDDEAKKTLRKLTEKYPAEGIHFIDSGNYHYMSRIWLEKISRPFRLLVFDHHTDMQPPAFGGILSCGGWVASALEDLPFLEEVLLVGPEGNAVSQDVGALDTDKKRKVKCLTEEALNTYSAEEIARFFQEIPKDLPMYLSVDKDVLCADDACTTWSQGNMRLQELLWYLGLLDGMELIGADICGECDPCRSGDSRKNDEANRKLLYFFRHMKE